jgi:hypothetical protein
MWARGILLVTLFGLAAAFDVRADDADAKKNARTQAETIQNTLIKGDYGKLADLTHPKAVEKFGGRDKMVALLEKEMKGLADRGTVLSSVKVFEPSQPAAAGKELYITVPFSLVIKVPGGRLLTKGVLLGVSEDQGKTWRFIDCSPGAKTIKNLFPDLPTTLVVPAKNEPPTFEKD